MLAYGLSSKPLMILVNQGDAKLAEFTRAAAITQLYESGPAALAAQLLAVRLKDKCRGG